MSNAISVVVDADIARASGTSEHPVSSGSRALLENITENGHSVVFCTKMMAEWRKHRSLFARKWLSSMIARKKVNFVNPNEVTEDLINQNEIGDDKAAIAIKDAHLIDAAIHCDRIIASNDDRARGVFSELSVTCGILKGIVWFNSISDRTFIENYLASSCFIPERYYIND